MYYEKYISFNSNYLWTKEYLEKLKDGLRDPLQEEEKVYNFLTEYINSQLQLKKIVNKNKLSESLSKMDEDLIYFVNDLVGVSKIVKVKCKTTQLDNPIDIVVQYLLDKQ